MPFSSLECQEIYQERWDQKAIAADIWYPCLCKRLLIVVRRHWYDSAVLTVMNRSVELSSLGVFKALEDRYQTAAVADSTLKFYHIVDLQH